MLRQGLKTLFNSRPHAPKGSFFPVREQPKLTADERSIVDRFHDLYYTRWVSNTGDTISLSWFGFQILKCPLDLWMYQEIIVQMRPEYIVETGTFAGGSALFMAMICDSLGSGRIISVDIESKPDWPQHPRIRYVNGSSVDPKVVADIRRETNGRPTLIILDSDHSADHVYREMQAYEALVPVGGYMIVEDTNVNGHPTFKEFGPGPMEALDRFLAERNDFKIDERCERFMMTLNPRGYLKRTA